MALFYECMRKCARKLLDTADIVRDGDLSTTEFMILGMKARILLSFLFLALPFSARGRGRTLPASFMGCYELRIEGSPPFTSGEYNVLPRRFQLTDQPSIRGRFIAKNLDSKIRWDLPLSSWVVNPNGSLDIVFSTGFIGWNLQMAGSRTDLRGSGRHFNDTDLHPSGSARVSAHVVKCQEPDQPK
jgi:hypothetical protein